MHTENDPESVLAGLDSTDSDRLRVVLTHERVAWKLKPFISSPSLSYNKSVWVSNNRADTGTLKQLKQTGVAHGHDKSQKGKRDDNTCSQDGASTRQRGSIICSR